MPKAVPTAEERLIVDLGAIEVEALSYLHGSVLKLVGDLRAESDSDDEVSKEIRAAIAALEPLAIALMDVELEAHTGSRKADLDGCLQATEALVDVDLPRPLSRALDAARGGLSKLSALRERCEKIAVTDIDPPRLRRIPDQELLSVHLRLHQLFAGNFEGNQKLSTDGMRREDVVNAELFVQAEMARRDMKHEADDELTREAAELSRKAEKAATEYATIHPSGETGGKGIKLEDVLPHFQSFKVRMPFLYLVGGLANHGESKNDIDILMRGPVSEEMRRVVEFRLGRMLPPELSARLQLHDDEYGGPFTNHVELADLVVEMRPRFDVKQMREVAKQDDPMQDWPKRAGPRPASLQYHFRGKSVADYTPILIQDDDGEQVIPISELFAGDDSAVIEKSIQGISVWGRNGWERVIFAFRHPLDPGERMLRVNAYGGVVDATKDHSFFQDGRSVAGASLRIGESIDVASAFPELTGKEVVDPEWAWVMGFFLAEGGIRSKRDRTAAFTQSTIDPIERIGRWARRYGLRSCTSRDRSQYRIEVSGLGVWGDFYWTSGHGTEGASHLKRVPTWVFSWNEEGRRSFVEGFIAGDGLHSAHDKTGMSFGQVSQIAAQGVTWLMASLGYGPFTVESSHLFRVRPLFDAKHNRTKPRGEIAKLIESLGGRPLVGSENPNFVAGRYASHALDVAAARANDPTWWYSNKRWVYDIETESHSFVAGIGLVLAHNSLHADLRFQVDDYLVGWTIALQKAGAVPEVATIEEAKRIAATFSLDGSRYTKPIVAPAKVYATPKSRQPLDWLNIDAEVFEPGSVGATRYEEGVIVEVDRPQVEWGCFPPDELIVTERGVRAISDVRIGDRVLGAEGGFVRVREKFSRRHEGTLIEVTPSHHSPIRMTPNHPVLRAQYEQQRGREFTRIDAIDPKDLKWEWVSAEALGEGDWVRIPRSPTLSRIPIIDYGAERALSFEGETAWLLGLFVGDGHASEANGQIAIYCSEEEAILRCIEAFKNLGYQARRQPRPGCTAVIINDLDLARAFRDHFYTPERKKTIPIGFVNAPSASIRSFLKGYWDADGGEGAKQYVISTCSEEIGRALPWLMMHAGIEASICRYYLRSKWARSPYVHMVQWKKHAFVVGDEVPRIPDDVRKRTIDLGKDGFAMRLREIKILPYAGEVVNLETEDSTICVPLVTHNSQKAYSHEYFLSKGKELNGIFHLRLLAGGKAVDGETPEGETFWTAFVSKEYLPSVLRRRAVETESMPPDGFSGLPKTLEDDVPDDFRYWLKTGTNARRIRDELVASRWLTPSNVALVDGQFRRVEQKFYLAPHVEKVEAVPQLRIAGPVQRVQPDPGWRLALLAVPPETCAYLQPEGPRELARVIDLVAEREGRWLVSAPDSPLALSELSRVGRPFRVVGLAGRLLASSDVPDGPVEWVDGADVEKQPASVPFALTWHSWKGPTVVRTSPSKQVWRLIVKDPTGAGLWGWELQSDPTSGEEKIAAVRRDFPDDALLSYEGDVAPGGKVGATVMNDTKNTPSRIEALDAGKAEILDDQRGFKKLRFRGKDLSGIYTITAEAEPMWLFSRGSAPGRPVEKAADHKGSNFLEHARAWVKEKGLLDAGSDYDGMLGEAIVRMAETFSAEGHSGMSAMLARAYFDYICDAWDGMATFICNEEEAKKVRAALEKRLLSGVSAFLAKAEEVRDIELADGTVLPNVQVWDPTKVTDGDDRDNDRKRFRPLALFRPMKVSGRVGTENTTFEETERFATPEALKVGIVVEPKYNGFRVVAQKDADGRILLMSEEALNRKQPIQNVEKVLPGLAKAMAALRGPYALDCEFMAYEDGEAVPRRDLARYRGTSTDIDDEAVRLECFRALVLPGGNMLAQGEAENHASLTPFLSDAKQIRIAPRKVVRTMDALRSAVKWAATVPGSEGAMLKLANTTYSLGGETDSWAKLRLARTVRAIVYDRHPVKDSPGTFNYFGAVGPIPAAERGRWAEVVEVKGKFYTPIGKTFNVALDLRVGDVITVSVTELLVDESGPKRRVHWFLPVVDGKADAGPMTPSDIARLAYESEVKKLADLPFEKAVPIIKTEEERYVLGIVLEPETTDAQNDIYSEEEIRHAAHRFMEEFRGVGLMHRLDVSDKVKILESWISPTAFDISGQHVKKGTWLLAYRILDDELWRQVKSEELTGFSIGGSAIRKPEREET